MKGDWDADRDPLVALGQGNSALFEEFVSLEFPTLRGFFERIGAGSSEAEDLAQDVFLKLFRSAEGYEPRMRFAAYAMRIARNVWIDHTRKRAVRPRLRAVGPMGDEDEATLPEPALDRPDAEPAHGMMVIEEAERLRDAMGGLSEPHRLVFEMAVIQGLAYSEISEALEIPVGTVKSRVFHSVRKLREAVGSNEEERA